MNRDNSSQTLAVEDEYTRYPLFVAIKADYYFSVDSLLRSGIEVNTRLTSGETPLHLAVQEGKIHLVALLLKHGADVTVKCKKGYTPLHYALNTNISDKISSLLLNHGADINAKDDQGWTPLHHAIICEDDEAINYFWAHKRIDVNAVSYEGETPLQLLANYDNPAVLNKYLAECVDSCIGAASDEQFQFCKSIFKTVLLENPRINKPKQLHKTSDLLLNGLSDNWNRLVQEVKMMQAAKINDDYSFYTLCLMRDPEKLTDFVKNESIVADIETNSDLEICFPNYGKQIKNNLIAAKQLHQKFADSDYSLGDIYREKDNEKLATIFANSNIKDYLKQLLETPDALNQFPIFFSERLQINLEGKLATLSKPIIENRTTQRAGPVHAINTFLSQQGESSRSGADYRNTVDSVASTSVLMQTTGLFRGSKYKDTAEEVTGAEKQTSKRLCKEK
ncbi:MAG: ankyrin repeat domain-containing protein [Rickettsiella sp.]|nr:ankyrin repeat domain-containing protein [Rickettsiella sp.]